MPLTRFSLSPFVEHEIISVFAFDIDPKLHPDQVEVAVLEHPVPQPAVYLERHDGATLIVFIHTG